MTQTAATPGLTIQGASALGLPLPSTGYARQAYGNVAPDFGPATWLTIDPDGAVTVFAGKVEYGQGIRWGLAIAAAEELGLEASEVRVVLADTSQVPWDIGTFGSQSTRWTGVQVRKAAATARHALTELAATHLDLPPDQLVCRGGFVTSVSDPSHHVAFGDLVSKRPVAREIPDDVQVTQPDAFHVMGHPSVRTDSVERVTGAAVYSQDVLRPGMLFARVARPPSYGADLLTVDDAVARRMPGVVDVIRDGDLVAVVAETDQQADAAFDLLQTQWDERTDHISQWDLPAALAAEPHDPVTTQEAGDVERGLAAAEHQLEATYYIPYVPTVAMEPRAAVAEWSGDRLTVWAGTQRPFGIRGELSQHFQIPEDRIRVIAPEIGGGFGSKSIYRPALEAARLAKLAGRPVRVAYTRGEEMAWSTFRPAALITIRSGFDSSGRITAWDFHATHTTTDRPMIGQRGSETPYSSADTRVVVAAGPAPLRPGSYRSLGCAVNHFARESHVDEIAAALGVDPVELRLQNLPEPRYRRVLETAATEFGWEAAATPSNRGAGVAVGLDVGSYAAECVAIDLQGKEINVRRVSAALDCGLVFNPEGAKAQMEGAIIMGLGTALFEAAEFEGGRLLNGSFARYRVPRLSQVPRIDVSLCGVAENPSTGAGEPGIVPIAPAIANALYDLTGRRIRELPLQRYL
ncbi:MAG TPA: molybdopterin cofactor-binding domain-containing protein [Tepidiformaceae bacterium]|nr:molybdopterin cofactor-binding domain-containing protein [Tepidiformaceae bacterium]